MDHTWIVKTINAEPIDIFDVYRCTVCGCSGGSVIRLARGPWGRERKAFVPGLGHSAGLFPDCIEAQAFVRKWIDEHLKPMRKRSRQARGDHHYASLIHDVIRWTPEVTNLVPVVAIVQDLEVPLRVNRNGGRMSLVEVRRRLMDEAGLLTTPREMSAALETLLADNDGSLKD